jgi:hypothetical protein
MTRPGMSDRVERLTRLERAIDDVLDASECGWAETVCTLAFTLAALIDRQADDRQRTVMAEMLAHKLVAAASVRGSYGLGERLQ